MGVITEGPVIEHLDVQVLRPGAWFILGRSQLGDAATPLAPSDGAALEWSTILPDATSVSIRRGGTRDGLTTRIDVGTMIITLVNAADPTTDLDIRPGAVLRAVHRDAGFTGFTGTLLDVDTQVDGPDTIVTLTAVDAVAALANTTRHGAANPAWEWETWERRVERLMTTVAQVPYLPPTAPSPTAVATIDISTMTQAQAQAEAGEWAAGSYLGSGIDPDTGERWLRLGNELGLPASRTVVGLTPGGVYRLNFRSVAVLPGSTQVSIDTGDLVPITASLTEVEFIATGTTATIHYWLNGFNTELYGLTVTTPASTSPYALSNVVYESSMLNHLTLATTSARGGWFVNRHGVVEFRPPGTTPPPAAAFTSAAAPVHVRRNRASQPRPLGSVAYWNYTPSGGSTVVTNETGPGPLGLLGFRRATILQPDTTSGAGHFYRDPTVGGQAGDTLPMSLYIRPSREMSYRLSTTVRSGGATLDSATSSYVVCPAGEWTRLSGQVTASGDYDEVQVWAQEYVPGVPEVGQTVDASCVLIGDLGPYFDGDWSPDPSMIPSWTGPAHGSASTLTPIASAPFVAARRRYDTRAIVNDLQIINHARQWDTDHHDWRADDTTHVYTGHLSAALWGRRSAAVDTSLAGGLDAFAAATLSDRATPEQRIDHLRWNAASDPELAARLDIYDVIAVRLLDTTQTAVVIGITHTITPTRWMVDLDLMEP